MKNINEEEKREIVDFIINTIKEQLEKLIIEQCKEINQKTKKFSTDESKENFNNIILSEITNLPYNINEIIENYLNDLDDIILMKEDIRNEIILSLSKEKQDIINSSKLEINSIISQEKTTIKNYAKQAYELANYIENVKKRVVEQIVLEATKKFKIEDIRPRSIEIYNNGNLEKELDEELYHQEFENIYKLIRIGLPVMLIGPTGSGKSMCVSQIAKSLGLKMYYTNNVNEEYKLLGFTDAYGKYKETQFYKAFKDGGLFFLDEIDNSHPSALLSLNSAIGSINNENLYMAFDNGDFVKAHPDFRIIAAANTWGNGANRNYCGRNQLDCASLDRFVQVYFDYDPKIEKSLIRDEELLKYFWNFRRIINKCGILHTVTTRNIDYANKLKEAGFTTEQILYYTIIKELDVEDMKIISKHFEDEEIENNVYSKEFKKIILKRV